jgi:hypothetical protein
MINNHLFRWYASLLRDRFREDKELLSEIDITEAIHGVALSSVGQKDSRLALRLRDAFRAIAVEIVQGRHPFPETNIDSDKIVHSFEELIQILDRMKV